MSNANIKIAQSSATLKTAGTLMGLWFLCVCLCFSSSVTSMISFFRGLQSLPGTVVEGNSDIREKVGEALKSDKIASIKLYKECEDTDFVEGFEAKLIKLSDDTVGSITTEDGVTIKKVKFENVGFNMTSIFVYEDGHEESNEMEVGFVDDFIWKVGCPNDGGTPHEVHGEVMYVKDIKIKWNPYLAAIEPQVEGYSIKK